MPSVRTTAIGSILPLLLLLAASPSPAEGTEGPEAIQQLIESGRFAAADSIATAYVGQLRRDPKIAQSILSRGLELWAQARSLNGKPTDSLTVSLQAEALRLNELDPKANPRNLVISLGNMGRLLHVSGRNQEAVKYFQRALPQAERVIGPDSTVTNVIRMNWGSALLAMERFPQAESLYLAAARSLRRQPVPDPKVLASLENNMGAVLANMGRLFESREWFTAAMQHYEQGLGPLHPNTNRCRENVAALSNMLGDLPRSRALGEQALAAQIQAVGPDHELVALSLNNLGVLLLTSGDYIAARDTLHRAIAIYEKTRGPNDVELAEPLVALGRVFRALGDRGEASSAFDRSLAIRESNGQRAQPALVGNLLARAELAVEDHRPADAARDAQRALDLSLAGRGHGHPETAAAYRTVIAIEVSEGRYASAIARSDSALPVLRPILGASHPAVLELLLQRSTAQAALRNSRGLSDSLAWIVDRLREQPDLSPLLVSDAEVQLADALWASGDTARAISAALSSDRRLRGFLSLVIEGLPERLGMNIAAHGRPGLTHLLDRATSSPIACRAAWTAVAANRGLLLEHLAWRRHELRETTDSRVRALRDSLGPARARLAYLVLRGSADDPASFPDRLRDAASERDRLENAMAFLMRGRRSLVSDLSADSFLVALAPGTTMVGYCRYAPFAQVGSVPLPERYLAFVGSPDRVQALDLGPARVIDSLAHRWRSLAGRAPQAGASDEASLRRLGARLRRLVWDPVVAITGASARVTVVADGALQLINFGALPDDRGTYLVERGPTIKMLGTERDAAWGDAAPPGTGLLAVGGVQFDGASGDQALAKAGPVRRSSTSPCSGPQGLSFAPLRASRGEVDSIQAAWTHGSARALVGSSASEAQFKRLAPGMRVVHLATHAFFLNGDCKDSKALTGVTRQVLTERPLLGCGLALANANRRARASSSDEDGLLTAEEIVGLDLSGVEWAVLSACETGLGTDRAWEGMFSLSRAFTVAGARQIVASLWRVDDVATSSWARELYRSPRQPHGDASVATRNASLAMISRRRALGWSTHPYYWGAFVATGN